MTTAPSLTYSSLQERGLTCMPDQTETSPVSHWFSRSEPPQPIPILHRDIKEILSLLVAHSSECCSGKTPCGSYQDCEVRDIKYGVSATQARYDKCHAAYLEYIVSAIALVKAGMGGIEFSHTQLEVTILNAARVVFETYEIEGKISQLMEMEMNNDKEFDEYNALLASFEPHRRVFAEKFIPE
jgi:hypothetical protein